VVQAWFRDERLRARATSGPQRRRRRRDGPIRRQGGEVACPGRCRHQAPTRVLATEAGASTAAGAGYRRRRRGDGEQRGPGPSRGEGERRASPNGRRRRGEGERSATPECAQRSASSPGPGAGTQCETKRRAASDRRGPPSSTPDSSSADAGEGPPPPLGKTACFEAGCHSALKHAQNTIFSLLPDGFGPRSLGSPRRSHLHFPRRRGDPFSPGRGTCGASVDSVTRPVGGIRSPGVRRLSRGPVFGLSAPLLVDAARRSRHDERSTRVRRGGEPRSAIVGLEPRGR